MEEYFREPVFKNKESYPKVIMPEEKDKIVNELINRREYSFRFGYKDVPNLKISKAQFEKVIEELVNMGMIKTEGYKDGGTKYISSKLDTFYHHGGFKTYDERLFSELEKLSLEIESMKKTIDPSMFGKLSELAKIAATVTTIIKNGMGFGI